MHHRHGVAIAALIGSLALGAAACGSSGSSGASVYGPPGTSSSSAPTGASAASADTPASGSGSALAVSSTSLGSVVVDAEGRTLYLFTPDTGPTSTCYDGCATAWPPAVGPVTAGDGVTGTIGVTTRDDGTQQVTLAGHPLYRYAADAAPGDVTGQGVNGKWYVVDGSGTAVTTSAAASSGY